MKTLRTDLSEQDVLNNMLELVLYLSKLEDGASDINISINNCDKRLRNCDKRLHMRFEAYTENCEGVREE